MGRSANRVPVKERAPAIETGVLVRPLVASLDEVPSFGAVLGGAGAGAGTGGGAPPPHPAVPVAPASAPAFGTETAKKTSKKRREAAAPTPAQAPSSSSVSVSASHASSSSSSSSEPSSSAKRPHVVPIMRAGSNAVGDADAGAHADAGTREGERGRSKSKSEGKRKSKSKEADDAGVSESAAVELDRSRKSSSKDDSDKAARKAARKAERRAKRAAKLHGDADGDSDGGLRTADGAARPVRADEPAASEAASAAAADEFGAVTAQRLELEQRQSLNILASVLGSGPVAPKNVHVRTEEPPAAVPKPSLWQGVQRFDPHRQAPAAAAAAAVAAPIPTQLSKPGASQWLMPARALAAVPPAAGKSSKQPQKQPAHKDEPSATASAPGEADAADTGRLPMVVTVETSTRLRTLFTSGAPADAGAGGAFTLFGAPADAPADAAPQVAAVSAFGRAPSAARAAAVAAQQQQQQQHVRRAPPTVDELVSRKANVDVKTVAPFMRTGTMKEIREGVAKMKDALRDDYRRKQKNAVKKMRRMKGMRAPGGASQQ